MKKSIKALQIKRHDFSADQSLRPYSAADEYLLNHFNDLTDKPKKLALYNDRFGFLSCHLSDENPTVILTHKSQEKAIHLNLETNKLPIPKFSNPIDAMADKMDYALMKAPKQLELFQAFLEHITQHSTEDVTIVVVFMTRHFSPKLLAIAEMYFEGVQQSRAIKKARLLMLTKKKKVENRDIVNVLKYKDQEYKQYWGVFSAKHIDYATQYFLNHIQLRPNDGQILDLASGNGVIAKELQQKLPNAEIHLLDDSFLAVASAKLNIEGDNIHHHYNNNLSEFEDGTFDLIVTNPPFHFEYEVNIQIAIKLFKESYRCLKVGGNLQIVSSRHLNYMTHLKRIFSNNEVLAENDKFVIYKSVK